MSAQLQPINYVELFRTVANSAPVLIWMSGPDKLCTFFNDGWLKFTGRTMEEEVGEGWAAGVHPDDLDRCLEVYTTAFDARKEFEMEYRLRRFDGEFRWIVNRGAPSFEPDGAFRGYVGSCMDVTERKRAEEKVRESEERLRLAVHAGKMYAFDWDAATDVIIRSQEVTQIPGLIGEPIRLTKQQFLTRVHPEDRATFNSLIAECTPESPNHQISFRLLRPDGSVVWLERTGHGFFDEQGRMVRMIGMVADVTERKRTEEELCVKEMEFLEAQRLAQVGSWQWDPQTDTVTWSPELYRITGRDPNLPAASYKEHSQILTAESWERLQRSVEGALRSGTPYELDLEYLRPDGSTIWARARGEAQHDTTGQIVGLRGTAQDITERRLAERELALANERLRLAMESGKSVGWDWDIKTGRSSWFGDLQCIFGMPSETYVGRIEDFFRLVHPEDRVPVREAAEDAMENKKEYVKEFRILWPDGTLRWVEAKGKFLYSPDGEPERMLGIKVDITERKLMEVALRESEERFRTVANSAPVLIWMSGPDKLCTFFNDGWLKFTGRTMEEEVGEGWAAGVHPDDLDRCLEVYTTAFDARKEFEMEYRLRRFDGEFRWIVDRGGPSFEPDGTFSGYVGSCIDITERKQSQQLLLEANEHLLEANHRNEKLKELLERENVYLQKEITVERSHHEVVGRSEGIRRVLMKAEQVAPTNSAVLLLGETGTGKELVARAIHRISKCKDRLMVKVNCAALPASLVENELFGREKGAYTGALTREIGRFELANESTIFLDEIGELPLELQAKLLRVLQEGEFERLGSSRTIHVNVRVIAATSRDLEAAVTEGKFREDLYYRLNVFPVRIPPLRERREDIPMLTWHFLRDLGGRMGREIESVRATTMTAFQNYSWPGNVRELRNVIERHLITNQGPLFEAELPEAIHTPTIAEDTAVESERRHILHVLARTGWRIRGKGGAGEILGLKPTTLESRMKKLGINRQ